MALGNVRSDKFCVRGFAGVFPGGGGGSGKTPAKLLMTVEQPHRHSQFYGAGEAASVTPGHPSGLKAFGQALGAFGEKQPGHAQTFRLDR